LQEIKRALNIEYTGKIKQENKINRLEMLD